MSLLPLLNRQLADLYDHFGDDLLIDGGFIPSTRFLVKPHHSDYLRKRLGIGESGCSLLSDKKGFKINLDVQQFKPEELKVAVSDGYIVVDGKHEERSDEHGYISRQFTRRYKIPENVDEKALLSNLSSDGVLSIKAPYKVSF